jgi:hypothetical protein
MAHYEINSLVSFKTECLNIPIHCDLDLNKFIQKFSFSYVWRAMAHNVDDASAAHIRATSSSAARMVFT